VVQIVFPVDSGCRWHYAIRVELEKIVASLPNVRHSSIGVTPDDRTAATIVLATGSDTGNAVARLENQLISWGQTHPYGLRTDDFTTAQRTASQLIFVRIEGTPAWRERLLLCNRALGDLIKQLSQVQGVNPAFTQSDRRLCVMWLELDAEQMRKRNLSAGDVLRAMASSSDIGQPYKLVKQTPTSLEYARVVPSASGKPDQYSHVILQANPDGQLVHFADVGRVDFFPTYFDPELQFDAPPSVTIVLTVHGGTSVPAAVARVSQKLAAMQATSLLPDMTFEVSREVP
jgi:multidrug efflux pump subunit AcrB